MFEQGWYSEAKQILSENFNQRPTDIEIDLVVVHCISLPGGQYNNFNVERLFTNTLDCNMDASFESLRDIKVSAHFYIKRDGEIFQFVSVNDRAWHAGVSSYNGRENCNDFSVGIELQGTDKSTYTSEQYISLNFLLKDLKESYPTLRNIVGHQDIAPQRKTDPGRCFDWSKVIF
ncbi:1,6-anhydro-N-acetylmuramyl-L-alanine amidase AmpD [Allofrancisella guangzhouensis]|uniref:1,6-anhydro-N-acetylmuramyl-L-alanine amidase AmpD n=1 Tax=Allofrancisella guangzhouensis TaxID=594679 RepID=A0A0A8E3M3_9GAMM|nr:1,6-anhydro-N-acetylmuramyl-L-alanine amidase AmpD [Allofrancisella guangzhouensis]AJC48217.1 N-acetyl-anhydromuranmyl-L-alanine amidase [Allofrancisella guangzhouensis]MBK2027163.1 1,6-anhydro-N-acetylmuramyl-L-alanine amidase AmpD [Allofrancisella guangzhouensis]MBK2044587.1 1,6-anhydro-N-acetylmuramyl-L-alanine amidase AmpD [Allofrancisella guangzhouensis]MBK2045995.1 1,6-anhydro-N-acetylmuramyl-L-alanine amidase AmpD [Allofrancisella guangzhouensis]